MKLAQDPGALIGVQDVEQIGGRHDVEAGVVERHALRVSSDELPPGGQQRSRPREHRRGPVEPDGLARLALPGELPEQGPGPGARVEEALLLADVEQPEERPQRGALQG